MEYQPNLKHITGTGGTIVAVDPRGIAADLGLVAGDTIVAVNGHALRDVIDYRFAMAEESVEVLVRRGDDELLLEIEKDPDEDLGVEFVEPLFDRLRTCNNKCPFCFLTQMPKGFRKTLYLKDDDFRLSFLYGNFVTLTNLSDDDWRRIGEQHLSPLYVSVHATDTALRAVLLGKADVPDVVGQIKRLGAMGITVHTQVVLCPELNDGAALDQTVQALMALYPVVQTIGVVPVGLTKFRFDGKRPSTIKAAIKIHEGRDWIDSNWERQQLWEEQAAQTQDWGWCARLGAATEIPLRCYRPDEAPAIVERLLPYAEQCYQAHGTHLVYPSDEFYLLAEREVPPAAFYDGYPQYSNGVGMVRDFADGWAEAQRTLPASLARPTNLAVVCGTLAAPVLAPVVARLNSVTNLSATLLPVSNSFFGPMVTVSGLLTAQDVVAALRASGAERAVLPRVMFDHRGERTLDEYTPERIAAESGVPVALAADPEEVVRLVRGLASGANEWTNGGSSA
jgi:NifB/MoaA-like Fe-S oxidoreductase